MLNEIFPGQVVQGLNVPHAFLGCGGGVPQVGPDPDVCAPCPGTNRSGT
jgi:hypothetical protein